MQYAIIDIAIYCSIILQYFTVYYSVL